MGNGGRKYPQLICGRTLLYAARAILTASSASALDLNMRLKWNSVLRMILIRYAMGFP